jgi:ABC-2 type transport system ATP-binding protein
MTETCIEANHLTKRFGKFTAVDDISFALEPGRIYGIVGPNGAGKSTTLGMIVGSLFPSAGSGSVYGHPLASTEAIRQIGYSPEFTSFYSDMSVTEYLCYMGMVAGLSEKDAMLRTNELLNQFELTEHANRRVSRFSTGMKKKASLAQAMITHPRILILDEPTANLDPTSRQEILETVRSMVSRENMTVLISSHVLTELQTVINHVLMINHGRLILNAPLKEAQEMFSQGILNVDTDDNAKMMALLRPRYSFVVGDDGIIKVRSKDLPEVKRFVVRTVYENGMTLNMLKDEVISLDTLYKEVLEGEQAHENDPQTDAAADA